MNQVQLHPVLLVSSIYISVSANNRFGICIFKKKLNLHDNYLTTTFYFIWIRVASDLESRLSSAETKIAALETKALNTGTSFAALCGALDALGGMISGSANQYHCCANQVNNKMFCAKTAVATALGITTSNPGTCLATDTQCVGD